MREERVDTNSREGGERRAEKSRKLIVEGRVLDILNYIRTCEWFIRLFDFLMGAL